jgi:hypothetical protein
MFIHVYSLLNTTSPSLLFSSIFPHWLKALQGIQLPNDGLQEGGLPRADSADDTHELLSIQGLQARVQTKQHP